MVKISELLDPDDICGFDHYLGIYPVEWFDNIVQIDRITTLEWVVDAIGINQLRTFERTMRIAYNESRASEATGLLRRP